MFINKVDNINTMDKVTFAAQDINSRAICDKLTGKPVSTAILDLYFIFILVKAENAVSHM